MHMSLNIHSWYEDIEQALRYARTHPRDPKLPPDWLRCDFIAVTLGARCVKGSGHTGAHEAVVVNPT